MNDYKKKLTSLNLKSKPIFDIEDHLKYTKDWRGQYIGDAIAILKPHDKNEVSKKNELNIIIFRFGLPGPGDCLPTAPGCTCSSRHSTMT